MDPNTCRTEHRVMPTPDLLKRSALTLLVAGAVTAAIASSIGSAAAATSIAHDSVTRLTGSVTGDEAKYLPLLQIENGCAPYSAVQDDGSYSGGLNNSGGEDAGCKGNGTGQAIVRSQCDAAGLCAHMYALYFPKDQGMAGGVAIQGVGHRHEYENVVVWVKNGSMAAVSFSHHSGYDVRKPEEVTMVGTSVIAKYGRQAIGTHSFEPGDGGGGGEPFPAPVSFDSVTKAAHDTLNDPSTFGGIDFPERDDIFATKLGEAHPSWL
jgi:Necrosis inducing protein (NPP1)